MLPRSSAAAGRGFCRCQFIARVARGRSVSGQSRIALWARTVRRRFFSRFDIVVSINLATLLASHSRSLGHFRRCNQIK
jgi:hypothetical protein